MFSLSADSAKPAIAIASGIDLQTTLLLAATMSALPKDSLLSAWLTENGGIRGLPSEAVADLHAFERWCVATKPPEQAREAVKTQVQKWKLYWLNANTVKGVQVVHPLSWSTPLRKLPVTS